MRQVDGERVDDRHRPVRRPAARRARASAIVWSLRDGPLDLLDELGVPLARRHLAVAPVADGWAPALASTRPSVPRRVAGPSAQCEVRLGLGDRSADPVTTSTVDCISSWRIFGCSPLSSKPAQAGQHRPASCLSSRVCALTSCTSHSTPSVGPAKSSTRSSRQTSRVRVGYRAARSQTGAPLAFPPCGTLNRPG